MTGSTGAAGAVGPGGASDAAPAALAVGLRATVRATVTESDTAMAMGSGDVPVLATPRLLALAEAATVAAVAPHLDPGQTSVGISAGLEHRRPSPLGAEIEVEAELSEVHGRRLVFRFIAIQDSGIAATAGDQDTGEREAPGRGPETGEQETVIGAGTVQRVLVDRQRFLGRAGSG